MTTGPLVSCIVPTHNRRRFLPRAIAYFLRQDYPDKELIIVDDGSDCVADLVPALPNVHYHRFERRIALGSARNIACEIASGSLIAHWDDDDWQASDRLSRQVRRFESGRVDICGLTSLLFYDPDGARAWRFSWPSTHRPWLAGQSLCYRRDWWARSPFPAIPYAEDSIFVWNAVEQRSTMVAGNDDDCLVALVHPGNTVPKTSRGVNRSPATLAEVHALLGPDAEFYRDHGKVNDVNAR